MSDGPDYRSTKELPAVDNIGSAVLGELRAMRAESIAANEALRSEYTTSHEALKTSIANVANHVTDLGQRMTLTDQRITAVETRQAAVSMRARSTSENDLRQDATIANLVTEVGAMRASNDRLVRVLEEGASRLANDPRVRLIAGVVWTAILGYLASKGVVR